MAEIKRDEIVRGSFWFYLASWSTLVFGLLTNILLARLLDSELFGVFSICLALTSMLALFSELGFNSSVGYFVTRYHALEKMELVKAYITTISKYKFIVVVVISCALFLGSDFLAVIFHEGRLSTYLKIGALYFALQSFLGYFVALITGLRRFSIVSLTQISGDVLRLIVAPAMVFYGLGVSGALLGFILAAGVSTLIMLYSIRGFFGRKVLKIDKRDFFSYGTYSGIGALADSINYWFDSIMVGIFLLPVYVGFYRVALSLATAVSGISTVGITKLVGTSLTSTEAHMNREKTEEYINGFIKYSSFLAIPTFFGVILLADPIVKGLYGAQYISAIPILMVFSLFCITSFLISLISSIFSSIKKPKTSALVSILMMVLNITLNLFLIPVYGIMGAALSTTTSRFFYSFAGIFILKRYHKITFDGRLLIKPFVGGLIMFVLLYPLITIIDSMWMGLAVVLAGVFIYFFVMELLGFKVRQIIQTLFSVLPILNFYKRK